MDTSRFVKFINHIYSCQLWIKKILQTIEFNFTVRYNDDVLSLSSELGDFVDHIYPIKLAIKDITYTTNTALYHCPTGAPWLTMGFIFLIGVRVTQSLCFCVVFCAIWIHLKIGNELVCSYNKWISKFNFYVTYQWGRRPLT